MLSKKEKIVVAIFGIVFFIFSILAMPKLIFLESIFPDEKNIILSIFLFIVTVLIAIILKLDRK